MKTVFQTFENKLEQFSEGWKKVQFQTQGHQPNAFFTLNGWKKV